MAHEATKAQGIGYGTGEAEGPAVDIDEVKRESLKTVKLPATEAAADVVGDKLGNDACPEEGAAGDEKEESQVAKKPRTEKDVVNGVAADVAEKPAAEKPSVVEDVEAHKPEQAIEKVTDEGEEQDKKMDAEDVPAEKSKATDGQGAGLRSLLQEGDTNSSVLNADVGDATRMVNGA